MVGLHPHSGQPAILPSAIAVKLLKLPLNIQPRTDAIERECCVEEAAGELPIRRWAQMNTDLTGENTVRRSRLIARIFDRMTGCAVGRVTPCAPSGFQNEHDPEMSG